MEETPKKQPDSPYPEMIRDLPEIEVSIPGVRGWLLQGERRQVVFFEIEAGTRIPPHSHCAQWGLIVEGRIALTIDARADVYRKGDRYFIPAGAVHTADFPSRVYVIDVFDDAARYRPKA